MHPVNETLLDEKLAQLERVGNWSPRIISKLESFIRAADDYDIFRVNPLQYAAEKGITETEAIDLFLHASKMGLFDLEWNLICDCCGQVPSSLRSIGKLHTHFICSMCRMENNVQLDDRIQVSFTIAQAIRENTFRNREQLSAHDYVFRYRFTHGIKRQPVNCSNSEYFEKYTRTLAYLEPGEKIAVDVEINPGFAYGGDVLRGNIVGFYVTPKVNEQGPPPVQVHFGLPDMKVAQPETAPLVLQLPTAHGTSSFDLTHFAQVPAGISQWAFENHLTERACVWVLDAPEDITSTWMEIPHYLSGKRLFTSQTFRNLYRSEVIEADEGIGIREITFLFTDLKGSTDLYDQLGDLKAYHLVRQHFDELNTVIAKHSGAIVKTMGDAVMAAFNTPQDGVQAALEIFRAIEEFNKGRSEQLILKIGLHTGHSIAVTLNDR